jgi:hypothetical protein
MQFKKFQRKLIIFVKLLLKNVVIHITPTAVLPLLLITLPIRAVPELKRLVAGFSSRWPGFGQVGFVMDKVVLG